MPKGVIEDTRTATLAVKLRKEIRNLEIDVVNIRGRREGVLDLLRSRDHLGQEIARLQEKGLDLRPERTRVETIDNILTRKATTIMRELRASGGLSAARREENPPEEHWWWYLDLYVAEKQRKGAIKSISIIVGLVIVLLTANYVMNKYFGMDPVEKEARSHVNLAERHLRDGETEAALAEYEQAVAILPSYTEAHIMLGVLYESQGNMDKAQKAFAAAEVTIGDRAKYLMALARNYQKIGEMDVALEKIQGATELSPDSAQALLIRGGIYEAMGEEALAIQDYAQSSELAQSQGDDALYVMARMRMGMLLQRSPSGVGPGGSF